MPTAECIPLTEPTLGHIWQIKDPIRQQAERRRAEATTHLLQPHREDAILDVGCGEGYQLSFVIKHSKQAIGIDTSKNALAEAKKRVGKAEFVCASAERIPFRPHLFGKVICLEVLEHLRSPQKCIDEINFVLKNKGILVVSVPYKETITMIECTHCGKLTPLYGHLHSFNERQMAVLLQKYIVLRLEPMGTVLAFYVWFRLFSRRLWGILDYLSMHLLGLKPAWLISKAQKP